MSARARVCEEFISASLWFLTCYFSFLLDACTWNSDSLTRGIPPPSLAPYICNMPGCSQSYLLPRLKMTWGHFCATPRGKALPCWQKFFMTQSLRWHPMALSFVPVSFHWFPLPFKLVPYVCTPLKLEIAFRIISLHHHQKMSIVSQGNCNSITVNTAGAFMMFPALG